MATPLATQKATAKAAIAAYNAWDIDQILAFRAPSCIHQVLPASLGRPSMDNATYRTSFSAAMPPFRNFQVRSPRLPSPPTRRDTAGCRASD
jgi:hypothetical protein